MRTEWLDQVKKWHEGIGVALTIKAEPKEEKPLLHPSMGARYRKAVAELRESLAAQSAQHETVEILRSLIDRVVLHPSSDEASGFVMDIEGDLAGILSLCQTSKKDVRLSPDDLVQMKLVAGARNHRCLPQIKCLLPQ